MSQQNWPLASNGREPPLMVGEDFHRKIQIFAHSLVIGQRSARHGQIYPDEETGQFECALIDPALMFRRQRTRSAELMSY
jgi:hypothetical protein